MKREIKFRAWDVANKLMYMPEAISHITFGHTDWNMIYTKTGTPASWGKKYPGEEIKLMQFTGLKDKKGKDIYEGDILKLQYPLNYGFAGIHNKELIVSITFDNGCFWFSGEGHTDCNWHHYDEYEVIGNIYENPELLK